MNVKLAGTFNPFVQAEGFMELGMFPDAWNALEELPPEQRASPQVFGFRVKILVALKKLEEARIVAEGMERKFPQASESWQALALVFLSEGDKKNSKEALRKSFELSPASRLVVLDDASFDEIWLNL